MSFNKKGEQFAAVPPCTTTNSIRYGNKDSLKCQSKGKIHQIPGPDLDQTKRFLKLLDPDAEKFVFQTFDDNKDRKDRRLTKILHGTMDQHAKELTDLNQMGAGIFCTVNHSRNGGRKKDDIDNFRAIWREADKPGVPTLPLPPHITVETSPGKKHEYLLLQPTVDYKLWDTAMLGMVQQMGSDPNAKDRSRVLRVPGFFHLKNPERPHLVKIIHKSSAEPYSLQEIAQHIHPAEKRREVAPTGYDYDEGSAYGVAALTSELQILSETLEGGRNAQLNKAAYSLGQLVAGGELDRDFVEQELLAVALDIGLTEGESVSTIKSGLEAGAKEPRTAPETVATVATVTVATWNTPKPLFIEEPSEPYPYANLPGGIREAVREVTKFVKCPYALASCSALSALSIAGQGLVDVRRAEKLEGPTSLYFLAIAESGERKTTVDNYFSRIISDWENEQQEKGKPLLRDYKAAHDAWAAKREGLLLTIKNSSKTKKSTTDLENKLSDLEREKPIPPKVPRILFGDSTPEALALSLAQVWPSSGMLSSEAGVVFGSHSMNRESIMRNLSMLNCLWGGETFKVDRKTSDSFSVQGARLTMGLAVQPDTIRSFIDSTNGLARGSGFLARFLFARPESTQGTRMYEEPPPNWPSLFKFHTRILRLLDSPLKFNKQEGLTPVMLEFSTQAKAAWVRFHDDVETELTPHGEMANIRDIASKAADNVARVAALFHLYEVGLAGEISEKHVLNAREVVVWHLFEALRFLNGIGNSIESRNAMILDSWLINYCQQHGVGRVSTRDIRRTGPNCLRGKGKLNPPLEELAAFDRVRVVKDGNRTMIEVNPALLRGEPQD